jgi:UDP-GlcNAc:undecaprenyl-phosphate GlcNAc-1-phosphate transferase
MELNILIDYLIISIAASMTINSILRNYAEKKTLLIDIPDRSRRFHKRPTPLTGGIGIFIALLASGKLYIDLNNLNGYVPDFTYQLMLASIPLVCLFLVDDIKGLKPYQRLIGQASLCLYVIFTTGVYLENLGNLSVVEFLTVLARPVLFAVFLPIGERPELLPSSSSSLTDDLSILLLYELIGLPCFFIIFGSFKSFLDEAEANYFTS